MAVLTGAQPLLLLHTQLLSAAAHSRASLRSVALQRAGRCLCLPGILPCPSAQAGLP